mmetsp:Transcript_61141/g.137779  ORF Transcript_61141/g.137779 Transcript_61141/m.137779 type:complete len:218 (+) Transcript_61141:49-702(+)
MWRCFGTRLLRAFLALSAAEHICLSSAESNVVQLHAKDFDAVVKNGTETPWLVIFHLTVCPECEDILTEFDKLGTVLKGKIKTGKVDASEDGYLLVDKWQMLDFPKLKLIRGNNAYTYYGNRTVEAMQFFVDPPQYLGWEVCPPEAIPFDLTLSERFQRKRTAVYYMAVHSPITKTVCNVGIWVAVFVLCHACCSCCVSACRSCGRGKTQDKEKKDD